MTAPFLRPGPLALVALGGTAGAAARETLVLLTPGTTALPWAIIAANLGGAFCLGFLYAALAQQPSSGLPRRLRLLLGTGFCGGFTTYSTLAVGSFLLAATAGPLWAMAYGIGTVLLGGLATWAGMALGTHTGLRTGSSTLAARATADQRGGMQQ